MFTLTNIAIAVGVVLAAWIAFDLLQTKHAILHNFPIIGHFRYWLEAIGPELRQYIVTSNNEERPFSRDERSWVYASAKKQNNYLGFGTDNAIELLPSRVGPTLQISRWRGVIGDLKSRSMCTKGVPNPISISI